MKMYYEFTKNKPPNDFLVRILETYFPKKILSNTLKVLDIGGAPFNDAEYLVSLAFDVTVVDSSKDASAFLESALKHKIIFIEKPIEEILLDKDMYSLITAQYSLPFVSKNNISTTLKKIRNALTKDGVFAAHFYGDRDDWVTSKSTMSFFSREELTDILSYFFQIFSITEIEKDIESKEGGSKHWHYFEVEAKK